MNKRSFIRSSLIGACGICTLPLIAAARDEHNHDSQLSDKKLWKWSKESYYYEITPRGLKCLICPHECLIRLNESTLCRNRVNVGNKLYSIAYGNPCAVHIDPIEKKPLFHFKPGSKVFSLATAGCNFACLNCQNWTISQSSPKDTTNVDLMPEKVIEECLNNECESIAYTYSEPITFYEYMFDSAAIARKKKIKNVMVSNAYINEHPLRDLCKVLDAASIDLKSFNETTYQRLNGGKLQPVLNSIKILKEENVWLELSNLIVPGWSDDLEMIRQMTQWLVDNGFQNVPLHFLRFLPQYKLTQVPPTPLTTLSKAKDIALKAGLNYVYIGNVPSLSAVTTYCPKCGKELILRKGITIISNILKNGKCPDCAALIPGRWN